MAAHEQLMQLAHVTKRERFILSTLARLLQMLSVLRFFALYLHMSTKCNEINIH